MTGEVTRLAALRKLLSAPADHADQQRIVSRVVYPKPDARVWIHRTLTFPKRRTA